MAINLYWIRIRELILVCITVRRFFISYSFFFSCSYASEYRGSIVITHYTETHTYRNNLENTKRRNKDTQRHAEPP